MRRQIYEKLSVSIYIDLCCSLEIVNKHGESNIEISALEFNCYRVAFREFDFDIILKPCLMRTYLQYK